MSQVFEMWYFVLSHSQKMWYIKGIGFLIPYVISIVIAFCRKKSYIVCVWFQRSQFSKEKK